MSVPAIPSAPCMASLLSLSLSLRQGGAASPGQLHEELLATVTQGDNVQEVSSLLCRGAPIEPPGGRSALRLAITHDRQRTVCLLLASGASLSATLLRDAWYSANVTPQVLATLTTVSSILTCLALPVCESVCLSVCVHTTLPHTDCTGEHWTRVSVAAPLQCGECLKGLAEL